MQRPILIGLGAGLASALLVAGQVTPTGLAQLLAIVAALPIALAAFAFGPIAGITAALTGAIAIGVYFQPLTGLAFAIGDAAPAVGLAYVAGLSRPAGDRPDATEREWFPLGPLLGYAALAAAAGLSITLLIGGVDTAKLTEALGKSLTAASEGSTLTASDIDAMTVFFVRAVPAVAAAVTLLTLVFNLWLAARIARVSGLLVRPWTPLWTALIPKWAVAVLVAGLLCSTLPDWAGHAGAAFASTASVALTLSGLATLHGLTIGMAARTPLLIFAWLVALTGIFSPALLILGIADSFLDLRARRRAPPPLP